MDLDDLVSAAPLFRALCVRYLEATVWYDALSDALRWSDELPSAKPSLWWCIRPALRARTCLILGEPTSRELEMWWNRSFELFPDWVGFLRDRSTRSEALASIYRDGVETLGRDIDHAMRDEG